VKFERLLEPTRLRPRLPASHSIPVWMRRSST
jgi:hypothetical protein